MFYEVQQILMFIRSKRAIKRRLQNGSCAISSRRDCRWPCAKTCFVAPSERHMFPSRRRILVTVLNEFKLFPRSRDDEAIINIPLYKERDEFYPQRVREKVCLERIIVSCVVPLR
jgi:hypothetical protein